MIEILQYEFMRNAIFAGILAAIACGIVGSFVVVKRLVFISGGISHAAFGGIGIGYFLGINPIIGAIFFALFSAIGIGVVSKKTKREDTSIGILWASGMAIGIIFIGLAEGYAPDLFSYLFGSILTVPQSDLIIMLFLNLIIILIVFVFYKELLAVSYDEEYARAIGIPVDKIYLILLCLIAITVVLLIRIVGIILVIALLTIPAATASQFTGNLKKMMVLSILFGILFTISGLWLSYILDIPSGATIILVSAAAFFILSLLNKKYRER